MALRSTIYKAQLAVADVDRGYYADHALTVARHPSETSERMMVRVLAFALHASERLVVDIAGSGSVRYTGDPKDITRNIHGSGTVAPL